MKKKSIVALLVYIASFLLVNIVIIGLVHYLKLDEVSYLQWNVFLQVVSSFLLFIFYAYYFRTSLKKEWQIFVQKKTYKRLFLWLIVFYGCSILANVLTMAIGAGVSQNQQVAETLLTTVPLIMVIDVIIFGPFVEEIIFRFVIFKLAGFRLRSVFISVLVFGLAHVIMGGDYLNVIPYLFMGGIFAWSYYRTKTIWLPIILHMITNALGVISIFMLKGI
ncbi:hypothetical protein AZF37_08475 [endosymbiont 'TC1' of Trimyema compressum]|uniref:CPBP family intramembrane glutamic endopeptidase n=1 Tax=endosymbiont 'TC1' of Trimyema compressum TaxID=243899 RepID=UPI0007F06E33|nr:type II CAAX endopeptidase family protein [endosymbiont 'TC1' of Trimyema compressum]AMP21187.1 hypothetical protein AZF37_08475 [endosymbiont 'TC1' of Trimyema compressum]